MVTSKIKSTSEQHLKRSCSHKGWGCNLGKRSGHNLNYSLFDLSMSLCPASK